MRVFPFIPIPASAGISGFESPAAEYSQLGLSLDELLILHPSSTFIGVAQGDSMQGAGIFDGDLLIVDRHITAQQGAVIVANFNGEFVCKILDKHRKLLLSSNDKHQAVKIHDYDEFCIEGVVIRSVRLHHHCSLLAGNACLP
ncbi:translesion error-prone DNA polymerase V autoproteolytic subunit [Shewanella inventionis]|uniref:LexA family protein n=1 Tax=Shewanella inventionis TaxID=1738770 RepID=UPI001CBE9AE0|nr:translesion error-prone DNA polymerase V autoproteolytic subunit [Shewanella inventionis]UAL42141.1 translesion error-prone DNA polymerase V autoproteolytic subunit [Shewanella inventionis]